MTERHPTKLVDRLIFVFDADTGKLNAFFDSVKKVLMLKGCALCAITHGAVREKDSWRTCKQDLGVAVDYYHRDELPADLSQLIRDELPCVLAEASGELTIVLGPNALERCRGDVVDFRGRLLHHLAAKDLRVVANE